MGEAKRQSTEGSPIEELENERGMRASVTAETPARATAWADELRSAASPWVDLEVHAGDLASANLIFMDASLADLESRIAGLERKGRAVFLLIPEGMPVDRLPAALLEGRVDGAIQAPLKPVEVLGKLRLYHQVVAWQEFATMNEILQRALGDFKDDLSIAERLQKQKLPERFPGIKGFKVCSRYLAGMRSGGDHFDLAESRRGDLLSVVLTDSSSYGLSSAILSSLMHVAVKLNAEELRSSTETVRQIQGDLRATLKATDRLSLFYGIVSRKDYRLRYVNLGSSRAFYSAPGRPFVELESQGEAIRRESGGLDEEPAKGFVESELLLEPQSRLVLVSDGYVEVLGGVEQTRHALEKFRAREGLDALNEFVFQVKSKFAAPDDMPAQDCTAVVFDMDAKVLRLT